MLKSGSPAVDIDPFRIEVVRYRRILYLDAARFLAAAVHLVFDLAALKLRH